MLLLKFGKTEKSFAGFFSPHTKFTTYRRTCMTSRIRKFLVDFPPKSGTVNHWSTIASLLESKPKFPGIGLYLTSVSDDPFLGQWNEEKEDYDPPNWNDIYEFVEQIDALDSHLSGVRK